VLTGKFALLIFRGVIKPCAPTQIHKAEPTSRLPIVKRLGQ
jgi:hypothetical protein